MCVSPCRVVGRLASRWEVWESWGAEPWVAQVLKVGYQLPFVSCPPLSPAPIPFLNYSPTSVRGLAHSASVNDLRMKGALESASSEPGFYSRLFVTPKVTGGWRPVIALRKWQERWSSPLLANNNKLRAIRPLLSFWQSSFHRDRRIEIVLTRLRIGHCRLTHCFIFDGSSAPVCAHCDSFLTVEHILVYCTRYVDEHRRYRLDGMTISEVLGDNINPLPLSA